MSQLHWTDLPEQIRRHMVNVLAITDVWPQSSHMHGFTATLVLAEDLVLCKAGVLGNPTTDGILLEQTLLPLLRANLIVPALRWGIRQPPWAITVLDHHPHPAVDLSPASPDTPAVMEFLARLTNFLTPCRHPVPPVAQRLKAFWRTAYTLLRGEALPGRSLYAQALSRVAPDSIAGDSLLHFNVSPRTLRVAHPGVDGLCLREWYDACRGPAWVEAARLIPHLMIAGHGVSDVHALLDTLPFWQESPREQVAATVALTGLVDQWMAWHGTRRSSALHAQLAAASRTWLRNMIDIT